ncbi:WD40-repeat-containing domain protein [Mucor lusitanicus]|uniref:Uncharacterized protein n=2 Tax=Mucor circinelloides f. lusitanicus TaxID=29924 RepID=A0A168NE02_MUCCL|nr:hypothetical protein MUCCIDRAFT_78790 [Mucor lusitanicus CBS 277.49]
MHHLLLKLERQQSKQNRYLGKFKQISKSIKKTSRLIGYNANLLAEQCNMNQTMPPAKKAGSITPSHSPAQQSPQSAKRSLPFPSKAKQVEAVESSSGESSNEADDDSPMMSPDATTPHSAQVASLPPPQQQQQAPAAAAVTPRSSASSFPKPKRHVARDFKEIAFGRSQAMDIYTIRRKHGDVVFNKKPRSLLYNIADDSMSKGMNELMITTSLDGELQFWNAAERRRIKTIGKDHIYDSWIDDICWATPSTLAFCPPQKSDEPVKLVHIGNVTKTNVEGRIQTLDESPHENGISVIGSLETGDYNTRNMEKCSFVTGGYDKSIYLWSLKRESPDDNFIPTGVSRLNIKHTSAIYSLCYDKYKNVLFSGGADERLVLFDMQTNTTLRELRLAQRVSQIIQSKANPNIMLITSTLRSEQFYIYDQRVPGFDGIKLRFGQHESETLSRFMKPDMHENGYVVCCGHQSSSKLNFWDLRYTDVHKSVSFSMDTPSTTRILRSMFKPNTETIVSLSSSRTMSWLDYNVKRDEIVKTLV